MFKEKHMFRQSFIKICIPLLLLFGSSCARDDLFHQFQNPPAEAQPFVRWWWNGNCVEENEILRELDIMKDAGIGGIEINPIAMPAEIDNTGRDCPLWGSPEWANLVKAAIDGAKERGMIADMIIGTGWPFGGKFLNADEQIKGVVINKIPVKGPSVYKAELKDIVKLIKRGQVYEPDPAENPPDPELLFMRLVPVNVSGINECSDVLGEYTYGDDISIEIPAGEFTLVIGSIFRGTAFRSVTHGAPGADGPCMDHYNISALRKYCDRLASVLEPVLGGKLGNGLRALFVDSIELSGSNWTNGFIEEFKKRNGYDLAPFYPFVFYDDPYRGFEGTWTDDVEFADTIRRVRYDYYRTLAELFHQRFTHAYNDWCHEHGTVSRFQAYGMPWLMGMAEGYLIPDIPESNNWLYSQHVYEHGFYIWNKYTASGGHLAGRKIISIEAMTNTRGVFRTSLDMIKREDDLNFIMGMNHSVLHGFNYSPPEAGFPGWVRYGAYFSEQNPWWRYFKNWAGYNARLSSVLQASQPAAEFAILVPESDIWGKHGLIRQVYHVEPWYLHRMWEPIQQNGFTVDFINETVIRNADKSAGNLSFGPMRYKTLVLAGIESMHPETAKAISDFARSGGNVVFVGSVPSRSPSYLDSGENDNSVRESLGTALTLKTVHRVPEPESKDTFLEWTKSMIELTGTEHPVKIENPVSSVYQTHHTYGEKDIFLFINSDNSETVEVNAVFNTGAKIPWEWMPESGERRAVYYHENPNELTFALGPHESKLLVFEPGMEGEPEMPSEVNPSVYQELKGEWQCEFAHIKEDPFALQLPELVNLLDSDDPRLRTFAGTVTYKKEFEVKENVQSVLDLGTVYGVSEVFLNGASLGIRWWGNHTYETASALAEGKNSLEIRITTMPFNYVKSITGNPTAQIWTRGQEPAPEGLVGPVRVYAVK